MSDIHCYTSAHLYVRDIPKKGLGVFCSVDIHYGDVVEVCPYIEVYDKAIHTGSNLWHYFFQCRKGVSCLPLGYAMLYNHSKKPNLVWGLRRTKMLCVFVARKNIPAHTELTHNYGYKKAVAREYPWYDKA